MRAPAPPGFCVSYVAGDCMQAHGDKYTSAHVNPKPQPGREAGCAQLAGAADTKGSSACSWPRALCSQGQHPTCSRASELPYTPQDWLWPGLPSHSVPSRPAAWSGMERTQILNPPFPHTRVAVGRQYPRFSSSTASERACTVLPWELVGLQPLDKTLGDGREACPAGLSVGWRSPLLGHDSHTQYPGPGYQVGTQGGLPFRLSSQDLGRALCSPVRLSRTTAERPVPNCLLLPPLLGDSGIWVGAELRPGHGGLSSLTPGQMQAAGAGGGLAGQLQNRSRTGREIVSGVTCGASKRP